MFVPLAEATGLIGSIGRWALEQSCRQLADWQRDFPDGYPLTVEVNLAPAQLADPNLVADLVALVQSSGIDPSALVLEITESALVGDVEQALTRLGQLSALGVHIALDDFGTGYSSLSYLRRLPATILKIDKSFVRDESDQGRALLQGIVALGRSQGMQIICEGIERPDQAAALREAGCHLGQGHLWAPALSAESISRIMRRGGRVDAVGGVDSTGAMESAAGIDSATGIDRIPAPRRPAQPASPERPTGPTLGHGPA